MGECSVPCCAEQSRIGGVVTRRILVTGASGFVAQALFSARGAGDVYFAASRTVLDIEGVQWRQSPALSGSADWKSVLNEIDIVVHLAARVHLPRDGDQTAYFVENCDGTVKLAQDAMDAGVKRFIFLSTSKVLGDESGNGPLDETAPVRPGDGYAASKLAAEQALPGLGGGMHTTVLRPPLVYGPGVKANFLALLSAFTSTISRQRSSHASIQLRQPVGYITLQMIHRSPRRTLSGRLRLHQGDLRGCFPFHLWRLRRAAHWSAARRQSNG
ncbi:MAG: NAD-dependent epimerase/dehydratase family protein [Betaproteobacteria bacterium]|nr:NAD-dependent epimerase/dehydratase family protein [Betaproteobacteria bacterium]